MQRLHPYRHTIQGSLIRRYKRFLADVRLRDGRKVTAFCANSGSMLGLNTPGMPVLLTPADDPGRKTRFTLEAVRDGRTWVGVNTHLTNALARSIIEMGLAGGPLGGCRIRRPEVAIGNSRLDFLLMGPGGRDVYMEVKSSTLRTGDEARFPDAVTSRGLRHMGELASVARRGGGAALMFVVQRADCECFSPADDIDPAYAEGLREAIASGVHVEAHMVAVRKAGIFYKGPMPLCPFI